MCSYRRKPPFLKGFLADLPHAVPAQPLRVWSAVTTLPGTRPVWGQNINVRQLPHLAQSLQGALEAYRCR